MTKEIKFLIKNRDKGISKFRLNDTQKIISTHLPPVEKAPLTKRAHRLAKKYFSKKKHSLGGYTRNEYQKPTLPVNVVQWLHELDDRAQKLFKRNYRNLNDKEKSSVHNSLNE